jgi:TonB family protein
VIDTFGRGAYRPGGGKPALRLMRFVEPTVPNAATAVPAEPVIVEAVVRSSGSIGAARVVDPHVSPLVASEALRVVRGWAFRPPLLDGREVSVLATFLVDFTKGRTVPTEVFDKEEPGIETPKVVQAVLPGYTPEGLRRHISGTVEVVVIVLPNGRVGHTSLVKSLDAGSGLDRLALAAAGQ